MSKKKPKVAALQMKPTTVSTGFGTGTYNPSSGNVGYTLDDTLAGLRDIFYGAAEDFLPSEEQTAYANQIGDYAKGLFGTATSMNIGDMTSQYYQKQQDILRPERDRESARLADAQFSTGRLGYGEGTTGGYINPQQYALQLARENQNSQLMLSAEDRARSIQSTDIQRALGLTDASDALRMRPYQEAQGLFSMGTGVEGLGLNLLNTVGQFAPIQYGWQTAQQANQQAINNAKASGGGFLGGLGGTLLNAGLGYATGGTGGAFSKAFSAAGGINPLTSLQTSLGTSLGGWTSGLFGNRLPVGGVGTSVI